MTGSALFWIAFGFGAWDGIRRIRHHSNFGAQSLQITPSGIRLGYGNTKLPQEITFAPDWCVALLNVLKTVSLAWTAMNAVEIFDLSNGQQPSTKLGILNPADFFPFYFLILENYQTWLEQNVPSYFQTPAEIQADFISEDPFHHEILQLLEASRKRAQDIGENGQTQYDFMGHGEEVPTLHQESALVPAPSEDGGTIPRQDLRYSITSYAPHFKDGERILFVYHAPNPSHEWKTPVNLGTLFGFIIITCIFLIGAGVSSMHSPWYLVFISFGMIAGIFGILFLWATAADYLRLRALEMVFTTTHIHYKAKYKYEAVPYNKILEVRRVHFNPKTCEYRKVLFLRNERPLLTFAGEGYIDIGMPEGISFVPRDSPMFMILKAQGVFVSED